MIRNNGHNRYWQNSFSVINRSLEGRRIILILPLFHSGTRCNCKEELRYMRKTYTNNIGNIYLILRESWSFISFL